MKIFTALLLLALQAADQDVIRLKDGTTRSGRIASETETQIVLEIFIKGSKGETIGSGKVTIEKKDVERIERASAEARQKADERSQAFSGRAQRRAEALAALKPVAIDFEGFRGLQVAGRHFVLESSCDVLFVKDVALCLEEVFAAYGKYFDVRRNADRKLKVYLFAGREEYDAFQMRRNGGVLGNAAYYNAKDNYVAAYNMVQRAEERRIRGEIVALENAIQGFRNDVVSAERKVDSVAKDLRKQIQDAAAAERRRVRAEGGGDAALRQVDRWEREKQEELKKEEARVQGELRDARKKADEAVAANRKVIEANERTLARQNQGMFELLFHESFHAFASNHLWEGSARAEFPRWLHEGMASYFETSAVEAGGLIHGAPHRDFVKLLETKLFLPVEKILRGGPETYALVHPSHKDRVAAAYAQSWLLAHWLSRRATKEQIAAYVADVLAGKDPVQAFETLAGRKLAQIDAELPAYFTSLR